MSVQDALFIVQILLALALITLVLLQTKGGGLSSIFGVDSSSVYRTRRGLERRMFQATILVSGLFFVISVLNSLKL